MKPLAISLGDPAGIGPEIIVESWARRIEGLPPFAVVANAQVLRDAAHAKGLDVAVKPIADFSETLSVFSDAIPVLGELRGDYHPGAPDPLGAQMAYDALRIATNIALSDPGVGVVTAPVAKAQLADVGFAFPGQTEFLADACAISPEHAVMMLAGPQLRSIPLTVHCALSEVPSRITKGLIVERATIAANALQRDFGIAQPHIAVCGLNPHAGEDGRMGDEEIREIRPAIEALQAAGINASGPHPADAIYAPHKRGSYDAVLAMYHDQALAPMKALDFDQGVNVTLGLPIVRTSPDHGTAFDIAGKGIASASSMIAAIRMASEMATRRAATP